MVVFRLLTAASIEGHIAAVAEDKRKLTDSSITGACMCGCGCGCGRCCGGPGQLEGSGAMVPWAAKAQRPPVTRYVTTSCDRTWWAGVLPADFKSSRPFYNDNPSTPSPGGFFDGTTSAEQRRQYLLRLFATSGSDSGGPATATAAADGGAAAAATANADGGAAPTEAAAAAAATAAAAAGWLSDAELNKLIARSPEELEVLEAEDERRRQRAAAAAAAAVAAAAAAGGGAAAATVRYSRLLPSELCAPLVEAAVEAGTPKDPDAGKVFGRGMRRVNSESAAAGMAAAAPASAAAAAAKGRRREEAGPAAPRKQRGATPEPLPPAPVVIENLKGMEIEVRISFCELAGIEDVMRETGVVRYKRQLNARLALTLR